MPFLQHSYAFDMKESCCAYGGEYGKEKVFAFEEGGEEGKEEDGIVNDGFLRVRL